MFRKALTVFGGVAVCVLAGAAPASAATITFDNSGSFAGTLTYNSTTGIATLSGVTFDEIVVAGAPLNNGSYTCVDCSLSFTTTASTATFGSTHFFGTAGGSLTLSGTVENGSGDTVSTGEFVKYNGSFDGTNGNVLSFFGTSGSFVGSGTDQMDPGFVSYLGISPNSFTFINSDFSLGGCSTTGSTTSCNVTEADLAQSSVAPEPASMALFGFGLIAAAGSVRRRMRVARR